VASNNIDPLEKMYIDSEINKLKRGELSQLEDKIDSLTRALVETKASLITQAILTQILFKAVDPTPKKLVNNFIFQMDSALSYLRGRLSEEAIPEDAFRDWYSDMRKRLSNILTAPELDSLLPPSSSWEKLLPIPGLD
jgi:hypothetical protein